MARLPTGSRRTHRSPLDEPASVGGADLGPSPYDESLVGFGACTSMTMRMYARRKTWDVAPAQVLLSHERIHAADRADCETSAGTLNREITLDPELPREQRGPAADRRQVPRAQDPDQRGRDCDDGGLSTQCRPMLRAARSVGGVTSGAPLLLPTDPLRRLNRVRAQKYAASMAAE